MRNVSDRSCTENQNTYFVFRNFFFLLKSYLLWDNVEKCCRAGQTTDDNMAHAHGMLDTYKTTNTHSGCVILFAFHYNNGWKNVPQCYVIRILSVFLKISLSQCLFVISNNRISDYQWRTQEFFRGGFNKFSWGQRTERTGDLGAAAP
jgi:hypothetical protein